MKLSFRSLRLCSRGPTAAPARAAAPPPAGSQAEPEPEPEAEDAVHGCGWFDSSHDLRAGLRVREHAADMPELPLAWWLAWQLDGAHAVPPARA